MLMVQTVDFTSTVLLTQRALVCADNFFSGHL